MRKVLFTLLLTASTLAQSLWAAERTVTLDIPGMNCPVCPITVRKALQRVQGVDKVAVSYENKDAVVTFDDAKTNVEALIRATDDVGYPSTVKAK
jgi:mercuric ion binding protein